MKKKTLQLLLISLGILILVALVGGSVAWLRYGYLSLDDWQKIQSFLPIKNFVPSQEVQAEKIRNIKYVSFFATSKKKKILIDAINLASKLPKKDQLDFYLTINELFPGQPAILTNICAIYALEDQMEKSLEYCKAATQVDDGLLDKSKTITALAFSNLGNYYYVKNQYDIATPYLMQAVAADSHLLQPKYLLGAIAAQEKNIPDCLNYYSYAWDNGFAGANTTDFSSYASCLTAFPEPSHRVRLFELTKKAVEAFPQRIESHFNLGSTALNAGEYDLAYDELLKAELLLLTIPSSPEVVSLQKTVTKFLSTGFSSPKISAPYAKLVDAGVKAYLKNNFDTAEKDFTQAAELRRASGNDTILTDFFLALCKEARGDKQAALAALQQIQKDAPYFVPAGMEAQKLSR